MYITLWHNFWGHPENVSFLKCNFLRKLMVSDKKIHRAFTYTCTCTLHVELMNTTL